jgi:Domain of unknown function (DUF1851)
MSPLSINLAIDLSELDTDRMLSEWRWIVPQDYAPIQMTKFGHWFFINPQGQVYMLDLIEGALQLVAPSVREYNVLKDTAEKQSEWFFDFLVFGCFEANMLISESQCYGWRVHPMLGGELSFDNIQVFSLEVYQSLMGQILRQYQNLKVGDPIPTLQIEPNL